MSFWICRPSKLLWWNLPHLSHERIVFGHPFALAGLPHGLCLHLIDLLREIPHRELNFEQHRPFGKWRYRLSI
jgi:hypothetical protein